MFNPFYVYPLYISNLFTFLNCVAFLLSPPFLLLVFDPFFYLFFIIVLLVPFLNCVTLF